MILIYIMVNLDMDNFISKKVGREEACMKKGFIAAISTVIGAAAGVVAVEKSKGDQLKSAWVMSTKHLALFRMMNQWVRVKQEGKNLSDYFERTGYKNIAVYGMSYAGETLLVELKDTNIRVVYGIDQKADFIYEDIDVFTMEDDLQQVDAVVVTAITFFDEIEKKLLEKMDCPIISLEDILFEV